METNKVLLLVHLLRQIVIDSVLQNILIDTTISDAKSILRANCRRFTTILKIISVQNNYRQLVVFGTFFEA